MPPARVTMSEIARTAGVSRSAVSFVLNNVPDARIGPDTRQRILEVARELNYVPDSAATRLAGGNIGTIALILRRNQHQVITDRFLAQALFGISAAVKEQGFSILVEPLDPADQTATYGNLVRSRRADGMIVWGPRMDDLELNRIHAEGFPIVLIGSLPGSDIPSISVHNVNGACMAVNHLLDLGHQRIACITEAPLDYKTSRDRLTGYRVALEEAGITFDERLVRHADFTDEGGARAMIDLLGERPRVTAVFAGSDVVALGALNAIRAQKTIQVPDDIALVGFGDIPLAEYVVPALTTMRVPAYELGFRSGEMLTRLLTDRAAIIESITLSAELVVRDSCGANIAPATRRNG
jgi:LacI family transcriptional regulator, galactose operon repressor